MIDLKTYKQTLIKNGLTNLSEEEIVELRDQQEQMAEIFFNLWNEEIKENECEV